MALSVFVEYFLPAIVLAVIGGIFGVLIAIFSKIFAVEVDERMEKVLAMLPGINCGMCGYPGCTGLAEKLVEGKADVKLCKPGKPEMRDQIKAYLEEARKAAKENEPK